MHPEQMRSARKKPSPIKIKQFPRRSFVIGSTVVALGALTAYRFGMSHRKNIELSTEELASLLPETIAKTHKHILAATHCFPWPTSYKQITPQVNDILRSIREHSVALSYANTHYVFKERIENYENMRKETYAKLMQSGLFTPLRAPYTTSTYDELILIRLPKLLAEYGFYVEFGFEGPALIGIKPGRTVDGDYSISYRRVSQPVFETIHYDGHSWQRGRIQFLHSVENFPYYAEGEGMDIQSAWGHIFFDLEHTKHIYQDATNDLLASSDFISQNGREYAQQEKYVSRGATPNERRQRALSLAYWLAISDSNYTLAGPSQFLDFQIQHHEDTHVVDALSGRMASLFSKEVNFSHSTERISFVLTTLAHFEASAILSEFCNSHIDSFGIADTLSKAYHFTTGTSSTDTPCVQQHAAGANFVVELIVEHIASTPSHFGLTIRDPSLLTLQEQIILQLPLLKDNPAAREALKKHVSKHIFVNYYEDRL
jgi:hypothetical protein